MNFNTGQIMDASTSVDVSYPINEKLKMSGGISASAMRNRPREDEYKAHLEISLTNGTNNLTLQCSITDKPNSPINKECTASASINF